MRNLLAILFAAGLVFGTSGEAAAANKALLQATAQLHLDAMSVDGAIIHLDSRTGDFIELYVSQSHPVVYQVDDNYVLCADLVMADGDRRTIDIYVADLGGRYKITETIIGDRTTLKKLMAEGRTKRLQ